MKKNYLGWFPFKKSKPEFQRIGKRDNIVLLKQDQNIVITIIPTSFRDHFYVMIESMKFNIIELIGVMKSDELQKLIRRNPGAERLIKRSKRIQVLNLMPHPKPE